MALPCAVVFVLLFHSVFTCCPHEDTSLKKFSDEYGNLAKSANISITDAILLDVTLLDVSFIDINGNGRLVFNQGHDITVKVKGITVRDNATLEIGSEFCRHLDNVNIVLQGTRTADRSQLYEPVKGAGEKFIVVTDQASLHIYGQEKLAWTKLNQTIPEMTYAQNHVYWHKVSADQKTKHWYDGLSLYIFDATLNKKFYFAYDLAKDTVAEEEAEAGQMIEALNGVAEGDLVAISIQKDFNPKPLTNLNALYNKIEAVAGMNPGSLLLRTAQLYDAFSLIFMKGGSYKQAHVVAIDQIPGRALVSLSYQGHKVTAESLVYYQGRWLSFIDLRILVPEVGYPEIRLAGDVSSWRAGDKILITSTDYAWQHAEVRTIHQVTGIHTLKLSDELVYRHFGEIENGVDMRAEVALLSRNLKIEGEMSRDCPASNENCDRVPFDGYGGHIKIINNFTSVVIDGAELEHMGQATDMGFYPIHFHMCLDVTGKPAIVRQNSIHSTFARAVTVHGTYGTSPSQPGVQLIDNVAYSIHGMAYFLEDGIERATMLIRNLVAGVMNIDEQFVTDRTKASGFWITTPQAVLIGNVAAGSPGFGFWYVFPDAPVGPSAGKVYQPLEVTRTPIWTCDSNVAHSNFRGGLRFDDRLVDHVGNIDGDNNYKPLKDPLDSNSETVKVQIVRMTLYKNRNINAWVRGGEIEMMQYSSAESRRGLQLAKNSNQAQYMKKGIFVGKSDRNGEELGYPDYTPLPHYLGVVYYDGPVYFENAWFTNFDSDFNSTFRAGALGFNPTTKIVINPGSHAKDLRFGFEDTTGGNRVFDNFDEDDDQFAFKIKNGHEQSSFRDLDGSVTRCPGVGGDMGRVTVVKPDPFVLTENCKLRPNWQMAICQELFGKLSFVPYDVFSGSRADFDMASVVRRRRYDNPASMAYEDHDGLEQSVANYMAVLGDTTFYYEHQYLNDFPKHAIVRGLGTEKGFPVVIGMCLPANTPSSEVTLVSYSPGSIPAYRMDFQEVGSLQQLSADSAVNRYYVDGRMLYMKIHSNETRDPSWDKFDNQPCAGRNCPIVAVKLTTQRPYTPCWTTTPEQLNDAVNLDELPVEDCQYQTSLPEPDWGAGDSIQLSRDGVWGDWTSWSQCCNDGVRAEESTRRRLCDNPPKLGDGLDCVGLEQEVVACPADC